MPVSEILLLRHGHRLAWNLDPTTGKYTSNHPFPTRLPADPPLASHGVGQAKETGKYLSELLFPLAQSDRLRIYSSLFYRCLETLRPTVESLSQKLFSGEQAQIGNIPALTVRGERGVGEWFGHAWFIQPSPASASVLRRDFFPWLDEDYVSRLIPDEHGEHIEVIHERIARALERVVQDVDNEYALNGRGAESVTILICGHAAQIICAGRALTGRVPDDLDDDDLRCFTCGISKFTRRKPPSQNSGTIPTTNWRNGQGVAGGWDCVLNSDCSHLSNGEERGWHFHGDESFDSYSAAQNTNVRVSDGASHSTPQSHQTSSTYRAKL